jgi:hypothetical protein
MSQESRDDRLVGRIGDSLNVLDFMYGSSCLGLEDG